MTVDPAAGFARVYDVIYNGPPAFWDVQADFLTGCLGAAPQAVLDAGCGTGRHLAILAARGYQMTGLDASRPMLAVAGARLAGAGQAGALACGDLSAVPLAAGIFSGSICLESPLAYLLNDGDLAAALSGLWRVLRPGGRLVVDIFDYAATLGPDGCEPQTTRFPAGGGWVEVTEDHRCDTGAGVWRMRQAFTLQAGARQERFVAHHTFALRTADDYAAALEAAGFSIEQFLTNYPHIPRALAHEQRLIFVATRRGRP